jgi:hypothetical protein
MRKDTFSFSEVASSQFPVLTVTSICVNVLHYRNQSMDQTIIYLNALIATDTTNK